MIRENFPSEGQGSSIQLYEINDQNIEAITVEVSEANLSSEKLQDTDR